MFVQRQVAARVRAAPLWLVELKNTFRARAARERDLQSDAAPVTPSTALDSSSLGASVMFVFRDGSAVPLHPASAVSIVAQYCQQLSGDAYCAKRPIWSPIEQLSCVRLTLPPAAACAPIQGPACPTMKEAKGACAILAVRLLYARGLLSETLLPMLNRRLIVAQDPDSEDSVMARARAAERRSINAFALQDVRTYVPKVSSTPLCWLVTPCSL